jgi:Bacterial Ig-like domain
VSSWLVYPSATTPFFYLLRVVGGTAPVNRVFRTFATRLVQVQVTVCLSESRSSLGTVPVSQVPLSSTPIGVLIDGDFTLTVASCGALCEVPATVRYNPETRTAILDPSEPLLPNAEYTAVIEGTGDGDMKAVKDRDGTPMARDYTFSFTSACGCTIFCCVTPSKG